MKNKLKTFIKWFGVIVGLGVGLGVYAGISAISAEIGFGSFSVILIPWVNILLLLFLSSVFGIIAYAITPGISRKLSQVEQRLKDLPAKDLLVAVIGLAIGLFIAYLISRLLDMIPISWISIPLSVILYFILGYFGVSIALNKYEDWSLVGLIKKNPSLFTESASGSDKLLDTSAIIDGRIYDVAQSGFLEGKLIVPQFILTELRHIADSADDLKRNRGRRGLDILTNLQKMKDIVVEVVDTDYDDSIEVDAKLIKLAAELNAKVITNDYNLNKVASVQDVAVLNVNELSNAVKPVALPGESMRVNIVKAGKEQQQGVGFLDDGTMIVVQEARHRIGETLLVEVTSSLQTSAGRMIFARIIED